MVLRYPFNINAVKTVEKIVFAMAVLPILAGNNSVMVNKINRSIAISHVIGAGSKK